MDLQLLPLESVEIINHLVPNETEVCLCLLLLLLLLLAAMTYNQVHYFRINHLAG